MIFNVWTCEKEMNKIRDYIKNENIQTPTEIQNFLDDIIELCKKYNLSISHEDGHGCFLIEKYDEYNIEWLMYANKNY